MSKKEREIERQLGCAPNKVKRLQENDNVWEESLKETRRKNDLLIEHNGKKETNVSQLKSEVLDVKRKIQYLK